MDHYFVNDTAQPTGEHEVHTEDCTYCPEVLNSTYLGYFSNCEDAVRKATEYYHNIDGCYHCSKPCHTKQ